MVHAWRRRFLWAAAATAGVWLVAGASLAVLAAKERDNRFCIACHLHQEKFDRFTAPTATDLAGSHHVKERQVGCIACHGGADAEMRVRVWALAAFDTAKYLIGVHDEPTGMRIQLRDIECRQCHTPILKSAAAGAQAGSPARVVDPSDESTFGGAAQSAPTSYHALRDHDGVKVSCVRCHTSHTTDGGAPGRFISRAIVQPICRECHKQL